MRHLNFLEIQVLKKFNINLRRVSYADLISVCFNCHIILHSKGQNNGNTIDIVKRNKKKYLIVVLININDVGIDRNWNTLCIIK